MEILEPSGDARMDLRFAMLCCVIANHSMGRKTAAKLEEFLLDFSAKEETEAEDQQQARTLKDELMGWQARRQSQAGMRKEG